MKQHVVNHEVLKDCCIKRFVNENVPYEDAEIAADVLLHANLRGVDSHGVLRMEHYIKRIKAGGINTSPKISFMETGPSSGIVDGDDGLGHVIVKKAMDRAIELANKNGIGMVTVHNSSHCGALSYFLRQATENKMIGIAMTNTDKFVVPFGGKEPFFGTNPLAFGFPREEQKSIILDMATSSVAYGKVLNAAAKGTNIPSGWAVDKEGNSINNPTEFSALLPFGGAKGYGLAMVVDIFSGILSGTQFGPNVSEMYGNYSEKRKLGHFVGVIDISRFTEQSRFLQQIEEMVKEIHQVPPASGFEKVMVPGEPENITEEHRLIEGIPIPDEVYHYLFT